jgi:hypothetical protein
MKELRARVEDVSKRNLRYQLIKGSGVSKSSSTAAQMSSIIIFGIDEARNAAKQDSPKGDLVDLISKEGEDLRVIAVCGTNGDLGVSSTVNVAYENPCIKRKFSCRAWVRIMHPFNPNDFVLTLVKQFRSAEGVDILLETDKTCHHLAKEFTGYINEKSYLIVLNGISTFEEWNMIKTCFPNNKEGSRIVVCTQQVEVASLCAGQQVSELKQLSSGQAIYAFYAKVTCFTVAIIKLRVMLQCFWDTWEVHGGNLRFHLISAVNFYYVINKLIILIPDCHSPISPAGW